MPQLPLPVGFVLDVLQNNLCSKGRGIGMAPQVFLFYFIFARVMSSASRR